MLTRNKFCRLWQGLSTIALAACLIGTAACALAQAPSKAAPAKVKAAPAKPAKQEPAKEKVSDDEAAIRASAENFEKAFNKADAKAVADEWIEDGELVDEQGRAFHGRDAIEKEFAAIFADQPGAEIKVDIESIKFLTPEVAIEKGTTRAHSRTTAAGPPVKYTAVHVKGDGKWQLSNVNESSETAITSEQSLSGLAWLVGEWKADLGKGKTYRTTCQWLPGKSFLSRTFTVTEGDQTISSGTQIIGYSPLVSQIVSWTFDSSGGFGHEMWEDRGVQWQIDASSVLPDGATALSINRMTKVDDNSFTWQSVQRSVNEQLLPDTAEVRVERISQ